jgi:hypothetical protein
MLPLIKALLADRFKLKAHMEKRELPISTSDDSNPAMPARFVVSCRDICPPSCRLTG